MFLTLLITHDPINENALTAGDAASRRELEIGAVVRFLGVVRETEASEKIAGITYEAFEEMARHQFHKITEEAAARWPIEAVHIIHRAGFVAAGEPSLWMEVSSSHRGEAFAACQFIIDEMKKRVPIWKRTVTSTPSKSLA